MINCWRCCLLAGGLVAAIPAQALSASEVTVQLVVCKAIASGTAKQLPQSVRDLICGTYQPHVLLNENIALTTNKVTTLNRQQPVTFARFSADRVERSDGSYQLDTTRESTTLFSGPLVQLKLLQEFDAGQPAKITLYASNVALEALQDQVAFAPDDQIYVNALPGAPLEQVMTATTTLLPAQPVIVSDAAWYAAPAASTKGETLPEEGRLWAVLTLKPAR